MKRFFNYALTTVFGIALTALLISQLGLTIPAVRTTLTNISDYEGVAGQAEDTTQLGEITLSLHGISANPSIKVLQNGEPIAFFVQETIAVTVRNNSLIEIDGTGVEDRFFVEIDEYSPNISFGNEVREVLIDKNITILTRIFVR